jgi:hypothetical protein
MAKKKTKKGDIEDQIVLVHYKNVFGVNTFSVSSIKDLPNLKMDLLLAGNTNLSIPYYDNPEVAQRMKM